MGIPPRALGQTQQAVNDAAASLEMLFELGLPDTRGAKWVNAQTMLYSPPLFADDQGSGDSEGGNGWLVKEERGGVVDLVLNQAHALRGKKSDDAGEEEAEGALPPVQVRPADLAKDAKAFLERLRQASEKAKKSTDEDDYRMESKRGQCGTALLFLAHLQRNGQKDVVREALPLVLALARTPDAALNGAVSALANQRLKSLAETWSRNGDAAAYAKAIDALVAQFPRGWEQRRAAELLAQRLRAPSPAEGEEPAVKEAAQMLLSLTKDQAGLLPVDTVWLLLKVEGDADGMGAARGFLRSMRRRMFRSGPGSPEAKLPPAAEKFFSDPRRAAATLAKLLDDRRMTRLVRGEDDGFGYTYSSFSIDQSPEQMLKQHYTSLGRPMELGEWARQLLVPVLPEKIRQNMDNPSGTTAIRAWVDSIGKMSDEELAWDYMRGSDRTSDTQFSVSLQYLIAKGSDKSLAKVEEMFLDPAVWDGNDEPMMQAVEKYLARRGRDPSAFGAKLKETAKRAMEEQRRNRERYSQSDPDDAKRQKQMETAFFKRIDALFKPTKLGDVLNEFVAASDDDAMTMMQTLQPLLEKAPPGEAESQILLAAARTKSLPSKVILLSTLASLGQKAAQPTPKDSPFPADEPTRAAARSLLSDETRHADGMTVATHTAWALIAFHQPADSLAAISGGFMKEASQLVMPWFDARAKALVSGQPQPPKPDGTKISSDELQKLLSELAALPPKECLNAFESKSLDQQFALIVHLRKPETVWPENIRMAHLTITQVSFTDLDLFDAKAWEGRVLNDEAIRELTETLEKATLAGKTANVLLQCEGVLSGLLLQALPNKRPLQARALARMPLNSGKDQKPPNYVIVQTIQLGGEQWTQFLAYNPIWKDAALTEAWRKGQESAPAKADSEERARPSSMRHDPEGLAKAMQTFLELKSENRAASTTIRWNSSVVAEPGKESEDEE